MSFLPLFGRMVQTSKLDPRSVLVGGWADHAKCSMEDFCHPAPETRDLQAQGVPVVNRSSVHFLLQVKAADRNHFPAQLSGCSFLATCRNSVEGVKTVAR
jgi:hypothetical protein